MSADVFFEAAMFATERHAGQVRGGRGQPYVVHALDVVRRVAYFGFTNPETWAAAVLHDVVEDTYDAADVDKGLVEIDARFGSRVAKMVGWLTLPADCREDHAKKREHQIAMMRVMDEDGCAIKIADKHSNVHDLIGDPPKWSTKAMLGYAGDSQSVVEAALTATGDYRIVAMVHSFSSTHRQLRLKLRT